MKAWLRIGGELLLVTVLVPQAFVLCYFSTYFWMGGNPLGLLKSVTLYGLTISWVSAPFLVLLTILIKTLMNTRVRWYATILFCGGAGYLWLTVWNLLVYDMFSYWRAFVPVVLCSLGTAGYALARQLYLNDLRPPEKNENGAADLRE